MFLRISRLGVSRWEADKSFLIYTEIVRCQHEPVRDKREQTMMRWPRGPERRGDNKLVISQQDHIRIKYWHCHRLLTHHPAAFNPQQLGTRQFGAGGRGDKIRRILPIMEWEGVLYCVQWGAQYTCTACNWWSLPVADPDILSITCYWGGEQSR